MEMGIEETTLKVPSVILVFFFFPESCWVLSLTPLLVYIIDSLTDNWLGFIQRYSQKVKGNKRDMSPHKCLSPKVWSLSVISRHYLILSSLYHHKVGRMRHK